VAFVAVVNVVRWRVSLVNGTGVVAAVAAAAAAAAEVAATTWLCWWLLKHLEQQLLHDAFPSHLFPCLPFGCHHHGLQEAPPCRPERHIPGLDLLLCCLDLIFHVHLKGVS